jgi:UDP-hydrolysing UDP-N-acetyl-D-glucosamine 2-epimerase
MGQGSSGGRRRRICVVTGSRAEYGLLYWLLQELRGDPRAELKLAVTGGHLSAALGATYRQIEQDGFAIDAKVDLGLAGDSVELVAAALGASVAGFAPVLQQLRPDILVLLGDRYELLGAAQAAMLAQVPIAHIHGGERTEGQIDEAIRHSLTKMAHLHFVAAPEFRRRVIQLGEDPGRVFTVGATGLDNIQRLKLPERAQAEQALGRSLPRHTFLVTYQPVTLGKADAAAPVRALLQALQTFDGALVLLSRANADVGARAIDQMLEAHAAAHPAACHLLREPGQALYLGLMKHSALVVGNSSSGLLEAPALGVPTVNIGPRQRGRPRAPSVIDCGETAPEIEAAMRKALSEDFARIAARRETPYGTAGAATRIKDVLLSHPLDGILLKRFFDLRGEEP